MMLALVCTLREEDAGVKDSRGSADDLLEPGRLSGNHDRPSSGCRCYPAKPSISTQTAHFHSLDLKKKSSAVSCF